jgi:hypothetical protein
MATAKRKMVTAVFRNRYNAELAFEALRRRGYRDNEINVLMSENTRSTYYSDKKEGRMAAGSKVGEGAAIGGAVGTVAGATAGAIASLTGLALATAVVPGLIVIGPIVTALAGGGAGAVAGGLIGALIGLGIPESNAKAYEEVLRTGGVALGVVPHSDDEASEIKDEFKRCEGENIVYA